MPRTKISKSKRNREVSQREEKVRECEAIADDFLISLDNIGRESIKAVVSKVTYLKRSISSKLMEMKMSDFMEFNVGRFTDPSSNILAQSSSSVSSVGTSVCGTSSYIRSKASNPNDEGYLTEDSATGRSGISTIGSTLSGTAQRGRTPGPLSSSKARRPRRSKSFCTDYVASSLHQVSSSTQQSTTIAAAAATGGGVAPHLPRSKFRTPMISRTKALSADRQSIKNHIPSSPPTAFMRWPKPGELVMSLSGSPVVAQVMPDRFANVNIPIRNGVLSLRPKKLSDLKPEFLEAIDKNTLNQIKTLHENLDIIMNMAGNIALD